MASNVIFSPSLIMNVSILQSPTLVPGPQINTAVLFSQEVPAWAPAAGYALYTDPVTVGTDFGTSSNAYKIALAFFNQQPNPVNSGGYLVIIWRQVTTGAQSSLIVQDLTYTAVQKGTVGRNVTIAYVTGGTAGAEVVTVAGNTISIKIQSGTSTATQVRTAYNASAAAVALATCAISGTGSNTQTAPVAATNLTGGTNTTYETVAAAITRTSGSVYYFGILVDEDYSASGATLTALATAVQALDKMLFYCSSTLADFNGSGSFNTIQAAAQFHTRMLYYSDGVAVDQFGFAAAYAARLLSTNFSGSLTTQTMNLKQLIGFTPDQTLTVTTLALAQAAGVDVYINMGGVIGLYTSGANDFSDNQYNQFWFKFALQTAGLNFLAQSGTKIPQTEAGMTAMKDALNAINQQAVQNGFLAPGSWTSPTTFGPSGALTRNIGDVGWYTYSLPVTQQSSVDRAARKAPLVQIAAKMAGAIHSGTVVVNINA